MKKIFLFIFLFLKVNCALDPSCIPVQTCVDGSKCSAHGKCFYDLILYFQNNQTDPLLTCICNYGYTDDPTDKSIKCCYLKKSQFIAFIFEFIIGFGLGHFYLGNVLLAIAKLLCFIILCCSFYLIGCCFYYKDEDLNHINEKKLSYILFNFWMIISFFIFVIWQLIDAVLFGLNYYKDSYGVSLEPW